MKCKLTEYVKAEFYQVNQSFWTSKDINKFMDKAAEYDHECVEQIKDIDNDDLTQMIYDGNFDAAREISESMRKTMMFNAKQEIAIICDNIEDENINHESDDHGMTNNDFLMGKL